jgi:subtilisin family serine protease
MSSARPAWSAAFSPDALQHIQPVAGLDDISPEWAWGGSTGAGVRVAVIDSGIDAGHPAVGDVQEYVAIDQEDRQITVDTSPHRDAYGHGTACAGIIRQLAPDCELVSIKVLGAGLMGKGPVFAAGLRWAIDHGVHVCNLSLGSTKKEYAPLFSELADLAYFRNIALVCAANNLAVLSYPSLDAAVISVAAHDVHDPEMIYYNPTPPVEFGAQGIDVRVPWKDNGWITATGNSFAAPHVTGLVTRILGKHPGLTVFQLKTILRAVAANMTRANLTPQPHHPDGSRLTRRGE